MPALWQANPDVRAGGLNHFDNLKPKQGDLLFFADTPRKIGRMKFPVTLNARARNILAKMNITTMDELTKLDPSDFCEFRGVGRKTIDHINDILKQSGINKKFDNLDDEGNDAWYGSRRGLVVSEKEFKIASFFASCITNIDKEKCQKVLVGGQKMTNVYGLQEVRRCGMLAYRRETERISQAKNAK